MAKTKRFEVTSDTSAEMAMQELNEIDGKFAKWTVDLAADIARVHAKHKSRQIESGRPDLAERKKQIEAALRQYAKKARKDWPGQSCKTRFGAYGFRKGTPAVGLVNAKLVDWPQATELLGKICGEYLRQREEINKDQVLDSYPNVLTDDELAECGLKVSSRETFFAKSANAQELEDALKKLKS